MREANFFQFAGPIITLAENRVAFMISIAHPFCKRMPKIDSEAEPMVGRITELRLAIAPPSQVDKTGE
jgi:hypothetical protein